MRLSINTSNTNQTSLLDSLNQKGELSKTIIQQEESKATEGTEGRHPLRQIKQEG